MQHLPLSFTLDYSTPVPVKHSNLSKPLFAINSLSKNFLSKLRPVKEIKDSRDKKLLEQFSKTDSCSNEFNLGFFKYLAEACETCEISLPIPETIIIGYGFNSAVLLYNDDKGFIRCEKDFSSMHLKILIELFESYRVHNYRETFGPLAILRKPDSNYNRILMKPGEIILEWKNAYKVNVIIQRFIITKGIKSSKFRVMAEGNSIKVLKIVNKVRNDLKNSEDVQNFRKNIQHKKKNSYHESFSEPKTKIDLTQEYVKAKNESPLNLIVPKAVELRRSPTKHTSVKGIRKSFIVTPTPVAVKKKKVVMNLRDYLESCYPKKCEKSVEELQKELRNCRYVDYEFKIETEDLLYANYYRDKLADLFTVNGKNFVNSDVFEVKSSKKLDKLAHFVAEVKKIMNSFVLKPKFQELTKIICDFIEDGFHNTYFLKIKSFESYSINIASKKQNFDKIFHCPGQYCRPNKSSLVPPRTYEVLKRQLRPNSNFYLGINSKDYERVKVCESCYKKYAKKPIIRKKSLSITDLNARKIEKTEICTILEQINPSGASETCKIFPEKKKCVNKTPSTVVSESALNVIQNVNKRNWNSRRKKYFKLKIGEIDEAANQSEFIYRRNEDY